VVFIRGRGEPGKLRIRKRGVKNTWGNYMLNNQNKLKWVLVSGAKNRDIKKLKVTTRRQKGRIMLTTLKETREKRLQT